jgi:hypothetical protein
MHGFAVSAGQRLRGLNSRDVGFTRDGQPDFEPGTDARVCRDVNRASEVCDNAMD